MSGDEFAATDVATVREGLEENEPEIRRRAVALIADLSPDAARPLLFAALADTDWRVRREAVNVAGHFNNDRALIAGLAEVLGAGDNVGLRNAAVEALARAGASAVKELSTRFSKLDADGRKLAVEVFGSSGSPKALQPLCIALEDEDANVRAAAVEALASLGHHGADLVREQLLARLRDDDAFLRLTALSALTKLGFALPWSELEPLISDPTLRVAALEACPLSTDPAAAANALSQAITGKGRRRDHAVTALATLAASHPEAVRDALAGLSDELDALDQDPEEERSSLRRAVLVLSALGRTPLAASRAIAALGSVTLSDSAHQALLLLDDGAVDEATRQLTQTPSNLAEDTRIVLVDFLTGVAERYQDRNVHEQVLRAIRRSTRDPAPGVATAALFSLGQLGDAGDLSLAAELTSGPAPVAHAAETALANLGRRFPRAARELCAKTLEGPLHLSSVVLLGASFEAGDPPLPPEESSAFLRRAITGEDPRIRAAAVGAVALLGGALADELLVFALADEERAVQLAAARAFGRITANALLQDTAPRPKDLIARVGFPATTELLATAIRALGESLTMDGDEPWLIELSEALEPLTRTAPAAAAVAALDALTRSASSSADPALRSVVERAIFASLDHEDPSVVRTAMLKLESLKLDPLGTLSCLEHEAPDVRALAAEVLSRGEPTAAARALEERLEREPDRMVRFAIDAALQHLRREHPGSDSS